MFTKLKRIIKEVVTEAKKYNVKFEIDFVSFRAEQKTLEKVSVVFVDNMDVILIANTEHYFDSYFVENEGLSSDRKYYRIATPDFKFWVKPKDLNMFLKATKVRHINYIKSKIERHQEILMQLETPFNYDEIDQDIYKCFITNKSGFTESIGSERLFIQTEDEINRICTFNAGRYYKSKAKGAKFAIIFSPYNRTFSNYINLKNAGYKVTTFEKAIDYFDIKNGWDTKKLEKIAIDNLKMNIEHSRNAIKKMQKI